MFSHLGYGGSYIYIYVYIYVFTFIDSPENLRHGHPWYLHFGNVHCKRYMLKGCSIGTAFL